MTSTQHDTPDLGGQAVFADAKLLELERRLTELRQEEAAIREPLKGVASVEEERPIVAAAEKVDEKAMEIETRIAETPARGLVGVAVQLRVAAYLIKLMEKDEAEDLCALSAHEAVERLLKEQEAAGDDAELLRLEAELLRFIEEIDAGKHPVADDDAGDEAIKRMAEMELVIAQRPAHTPAGVAVKVRRLKASFEDGKANWDRPLFYTALDALARLAGRT